MANARSTQRSSASQRASARGAQGSRTTSRTGAREAWETVKKHPVLVATAAGVLAMGVGAYALMRRNGNGRNSRND